MQLLKLILAFAPWLSFLIIAHGGLFRLELGLVVALLLSIVMGLTRLHRGVILWVGLCFFAAASLLVIGFRSLWTIEHMGLLANGALALGTWYGVVTGNPFTLAYAKEHTPPERWGTPAFIRANMIISSVWGGAFTVNAGLAWMKMRHFLAPDLAFELVSYAILLAAVFFTRAYPAHAQRQAAARAA